MDVSKLVHDPDDSRRQLRKLCWTQQWAKGEGHLWFVVGRGRITQSYFTYLLMFFKITKSRKSFVAKLTIVSSIAVTVTRTSSNLVAILVVMKMMMMTVMISYWWFTARFPFCTSIFHRPMGLIIITTRIRSSPATVSI